MIDAAIPVGAFAVIASASSMTEETTRTDDADSLPARAIAGDRSAEAELCGRLYPAVRAFARRRLPDAPAEDFAADVLLTFVDALRHGRIEDPRNAAAFALGICRNLARDRARAGDRRRELMDRFADALAPPPWEAPIVHVRAALEGCMYVLTERARRILRATFVDEDRDAEIASALAITEANVRVIRHRSLASLRACLEGGGG